MTRAATSIAASILMLANCGHPDRKQYVSTQQHIRVDVPAGWDQAIEEGPDRGIAGGDGYVRFSAMAGPPTVIDACRADAFHKNRPYGEHPRVVRIIVDGQPGCRIVPTQGGGKDGPPAGLILQHPKPVWIEPRYVHTRPYPYLVVWVDPPHLAMVEKSLRFDR